MLQNIANVSFANKKEPLKNVFQSVCLKQKPLSFLNSDSFVLSDSKKLVDKGFNSPFTKNISCFSSKIESISFGAQTKELAPLQKCTIQSIVNIFETGKALGNYSQVTLIKGDPGHLTYGRSQTTLSSGNLYFLIKSYCEKEGNLYGKELEPYLDRLAKKDLTLDNDKQLKDILKKAGTDPVMHQTQDSFFDRNYFKPAFNRAISLGITTPLGIAVVYDSYIHGAFNTVYKLTNTKLKQTPEEAGEKKWIEAYVQTRYNWLANHSKPVLHKTVYRMQAFQNLINQDKWDLNLPIVVRGIKITEDTFKNSIPETQPGQEDTGSPSAETIKRPVLRIIKGEPYIKNEHVKAVQIALKNRRYDVDLDGIYNPKTESAVIKFQTDKGLKPDGIVGKMTYEALRVGVENKYYPLIVLTKPYQEGEHIKDVQKKLISRGYKVTPDGIYGNETEKVIRQFQTDNNIEADGKVGMKTYIKLGLIET